MNSNYCIFQPGSGDNHSSFNLLEGVADSPEQTKLVIEVMDKSFNYQLNPEQKALVVKSIQKIAENNQEITILDCFEEWNKHCILDNWNAYVQKYFLF